MSSAAIHIDNVSGAIQSCPCVFAVLEHLLRSAGRVLTRIQLCEQVWNYNYDPGTNLVDVSIQRLRRKVDDGHPVKLLQTVRGVGYMLKAGA